MKKKTIQYSFEAQESKQKRDAHDEAKNVFDLQISGCLGLLIKA